MAVTGADRKREQDSLDAGVRFEECALSRGSLWKVHLRHFSGSVGVSYTQRNVNIMTAM